MRTIVTGVAGFIGSHVAEILIADGHRVVGIDDLSGGCTDNIPHGVLFEKVSVSDKLDDLFKMFRPECVFHLAAYAAEGLSHHIPVFNYTNNVVGTVNVLASAYRAECKRFVFTSSIAVYGHPHNAEIFDESTPCTPCDPYGTAKLACEHHIRAFFEYHGGPSYTIFRPHNVFGSRQNIADPYRNVVGIFMAQGLQGKPMPIFGDGSQTRSFSHISSVARAIACAPTIEAARNQVFNIGGDEAMSVRQLADEVSRVMGVAPQLEFLAPRKEVQHAHCSHEPARRAFPQAYEHALDIQRGLEEMATFVKARPIPRATECPAPIEIEDHLPPSWRQRLAGRSNARAESAAIVCHQGMQEPACLS
jgi:UDP-glucose 4-epimerase